MARLRLYDLRLSDFPATNGLCATDIRAIANLANRCQRRLLFAKEAGEESWYGTFAEIQFNNISRNNPYITLPRQIARIEFLTVCHSAVPVQNQFFEYLSFGNGRMPRLLPCDNWGVMQGYNRNNTITFSRLPNAPQQIRLYSTDPLDYGSGYRVLLQGKDQNGQTIYSLDGDTQVEGEYVYLKSPFVTSVNSFQNDLTGIQKEVTQGAILFNAVDPVTGDETLFHRMDPGEEVAGYRRYYLNNLPQNCCSTGASTSDCSVTNGILSIKAICKLELIPVYADQDYLLLHNLEAMIEEAKSVHFSDLEDAGSKGQASYHHLNAIRLLKSELVHYYGKDEPAIQFRPFGSARLERLDISMM